MAESPSDYRAVDDRSTLRVLPGGTEIVRAMKHEPIRFEGLTAQELRRRTDKVSGSKFGSEWTLEVYVEWLTGLVDFLEWTFPPSMNMRAAFPCNGSWGLPKEGSAIRLRWSLADDTYMLIP